MNSFSTLKRIITIPPIKFLLDSLTLLLNDIRVYITYFRKYRKFKALPALKKGFEDHRESFMDNNPAYLEIFQRIRSAYIKAKEDQKTVPIPYQVGAQWQHNLDKSGSELIEAINKVDISRLKSLLENFTREKCGFGINLATDYSKMKRHPFTYKYEYVKIWYDFYSLYEKIMHKPPELRYPLVGNPIVLYYDGAVIPYETIRFFYCAQEIQSLLSDNENAVICEIGGGTGGQAYQVPANIKRPTTYILLDIPEVLVISSYFLMAALPEKRVLLFGEGDLNNVNIEKYDLILMPNFIFPSVDDMTVDLFFNQASFSEMDSRTLTEYINQIERVCKRYLMHINHNKKFTFNEDGVISSNMPWVLVYSTETFRRIYQHPWLFLSIDQEKMHLATDSYASFLYERYS
jgi:putative sugar O-methyltransferase